MLKRKPYLHAMTTVAVAVLALVAGGCSGDDPTQPVGSNSEDLTLSAAKVSVDGQSLDGQDIQQGSHTGPVRYEAHFTDHHANPVVGGQVQVWYGMKGMMGHIGGYMHPGELCCYDDGAQGDPVPGDGI